MDGVYEAWSGTVNGVTWNAAYIPTGNYQGVINAAFSAPISFYDFTISFWPGTYGAQIWIPSQFSQVNWISETKQEGLGYPSDITQLTVEVGFPQTPMAPSPPKGFTFINLIDPPGGGSSGIAETPEPGTWLLMGLGLLATARATRSRYQSSKPA
jgi:hypothetical protein